MTDLTNSYLTTFVYGFTFYGLRYLLFAGFAFAFTQQNRFFHFGRPHLSPPHNFSYAPHIRRELRQAGITTMVFALIYSLLTGLDWLKYSQIYTEIDQYPIWWLGISVLLSILLHDTFFYWMHRALHTKSLYPLHKTHHLSCYPTPFTAYSFSTGEAFFEALIVVAIIYLIPLHPLAFLIFQTVSTAYNVYGHCSRELMPAAVANSHLGKLLNTASLHALHHRTARGNYSFYFSIWDRLMGTLRQD